MEHLRNIQSSADVKALRPEELPALCGELRGAIIESVARCGGHLGSNLGAVELTVALHRVYDSAADRIVFDVGHQCYAHKMLTGRLEDFTQLRRWGGLSGFPKPCESGDDANIAGHASTSISAALGMARARTLQGACYDVAAVIGDGALTGGLAYEGLADCGASREPIVVVLNDNNMSISSNVGGMARLLARQRVQPSYLAFKRIYHKTVGRCKPLYRLLHGIKEWIKDLLLPDNMFEDMGFYYLGPIDGHDVRTLERTLRYARSLRIPVLVHVLTVKGKGYAPAEQDPETYHGVNPFNAKEGVTEPGKPGFSQVFGESLCRLAAEDERIVAITAAMTGGTGMSGFAAQYPARFFDVGIAEEHAVTMASGMARQGLKPVFAVYSSFLQRSFDMLIHDVGLSKLPVVLAVDRAGLVGADGETHQGNFDVGFLRQVPGMRIYAPASFAELESMLRQALDGSGPAAVRYPRGGEGVYREDHSAEAETILRSGSDVTVVSYGILINEVLSAAEMLQARGISAEVIKLSRLDTDEFPEVTASVKKTKCLVCAEECSAHGSLGVQIAARLAAQQIRAQLRLLTLGDGVVPQGDISTLRREYGIDAAAIVRAGMEVTDEKSKTGSTDL